MTGSDTLTTLLGQQATAITTAKSVLAGAVNRSLTDSETTQLANAYSDYQVAQGKIENYQRMLQWARSL